MPSESETADQCVGYLHVGVCHAAIPGFLWVCVAAFIVTLLLTLAGFEIYIRIRDNGR